MWDRNEARTNPMLNSMTVNLNTFGLLITRSVACDEDGSLVVMEYRD